ncbi:MAG: phenylacetate--CoA ligase family protein [Candidatus Cloacimonadota bacterium]|nr:MAG: phenylacetate--CoA ligase family protein [Candidatus Cloacimonadota bacterium]
MNPGPLYRLYKLRKDQWLPREKLEEIQVKRLRVLLRYAYENVKYYRKLFDSVGVKPEDIKTVEDLSKIPITTKSQLQKLSPDEIIAKGVEPEKCVKIRTSGSTGTPLDIILAKKEKQFFDIVWIRSFMENGLKFRDKKVTIWSIPNLSTRKYWFQHLGIMRREYICFYDDNSDPLEALQKANPDIISSVPSILKLLAVKLKKRKSINVQSRAIFSTSELLERETRELIESTFKVEVFDYYGSEELGCIGWECSEHKGYHLNIDTVVVQFIKNGAIVTPGERGELICTGLHSYAMPFIRYKIGDVGITSDKQCPCGRGLPLMEKLEGRSEDFIKLSNGKMIAPTTFFIIMRGLKGIKQYRIVQEEIDKLIIYLVKGNDFEPSIPEQIRERVKKCLQEDIHVKIDIVDSIPRDSSGKLRSVISKVKIDEDVL